MFRYYITRKNEWGIMDYPCVTIPAFVRHYGENGVEFRSVRGRVYGYAEYEKELSSAAIAESELIPGPIPTYYTINEAAAKRAKEMMSFDDYREGSKTDEYRRMVDDVSLTAALAKKRVDAMYHEKIDHLAGIYARLLADNMNKESEILARCPSVMIAGPANFPVRKKEKQNAAMDRNAEEWRKIEGLVDKIRSTGRGGISGDDPLAVEKLEAKLADMEKHQELMKAANAAIRLKDTKKGDAKLAELGYSEKEIHQLREPDFCGRIGYPAYELQNNNANIRRTRERIAELKKRREGDVPDGWDFDGGKVVMNTAENRLQVIFDGKPDADIRAELKSEGFKWAPSQGAWQRQLTDNAIRAARRIKCIAPAV